NAEEATDSKNYRKSSGLESVQIRVNPWPEKLISPSAMNWLLHLRLQLGEQVERLDGRELVQVDLAQLFKHRLGERGKNRKLRPRRFIGLELPAQPGFRGLVLGQHLPRPRNDLFR